MILVGGKEVASWRAMLPFFPPITYDWNNNGGRY